MLIIISFWIMFTPAALTLGLQLDPPFHILNPHANTQADIIVQQGPDVRQLSHLWKLVVYLDLIPYHREKETLISAAYNLSRVCNHHNSDEQDLCGPSIENVRITLKQIKELDVLLSTDHTDDQPTRQYRGLANGVGTIGSFLFGIMDDEDRQKISSQVNQLILTQQNEKHLLLETTSLVKSSLEMFNSTIQKITENEAELGKSIKFIYSQMIEAKRASTDTEYKVKLTINRLNMLEALSTLLSSMNKFVEKQKDFLQLMASLHHIPNLPMIIKPKAFSTKLIEISKLLTGDQSLPLTPNLANLFWYYQTVSVDTLLSPETLLIQLNIPIIEKTKISMYHLFSVPIQVSGSVFDIIPLTEKSVAINKHKNTYAFLTRDDLARCLEIPNHFRICAGQNMYSTQQHKNCEVQWLLKSTSEPTVPNLCKIKRVNITDISISATNIPNVWLFATPDPTTANFINSFGSQYQTDLVASGQITLEPGTTAIIKGITLKAQPLAIIRSNDTWNPTIPKKFAVPMLTSPEIQINPTNLERLPKLIGLWDAEKAGTLDSKANELLLLESEIEIQKIENKFTTHSILIYLTLSLFILSCGWIIIMKYFRAIKNSCSPCFAQNQPPTVPNNQDNSDSIYAEDAESVIYNVRGDSIQSRHLGKLELSDQVY